MSGSRDRAALDDWLRRVLGFDPGDATEPSGAPQDLSTALEAWAGTRATVIAQLRALEAAIRAFKDPLADAAIIQVKAIAANLTPRPDTRRSVEELVRYIASDPLVQDAELPNGFGLTVAIRKPLGAALATLARAMPA